MALGILQTCDEAHPTCIPFLENSLQICNLVPGHLVLINYNYLMLNWGFCNKQRLKC